HNKFFDTFVLPTPPTEIQFGNKELAERHTNHRAKRCLSMHRMYAFLVVFGIVCSGSTIYFDDTTDWHDSNHATI
ncbi:9283_t:CDS:1, partial [Ambispora gerdemannii]